MPFWLTVFLAVLFMAHWIAFMRLAIIRGQLYYWLLSLLFLLLTSSFTLRLINPDLSLFGQPVHLLLRYSAWTITAVTIPILVLKLKRGKSKN
jgi:hypothetical protein